MDSAGLAMPGLQAGLQPDNDDVPILRGARCNGIDRRDGYGKPQAGLDGNDGKRLRFDLRANGKGEVEMKHPEYDSPFELTINDITTQMARNIDEMSWQAVQRVGINVDKDKLLTALKQDAERYREAYANGYDTGYEKRDDDIVRCKDCKHWRQNAEFCGRWSVGNVAQHTPSDWYCADGERE